MAVIEVRMPDFGRLGRIVRTRWLVSDGTQVEAGDNLFEIESNKAVVAIQAPIKGRLQRVADEGGLHRSDQVIARIHAP